MILYRVTNLPPEGSVNFPKFLPPTWQDYVLGAKHQAARERRISAAVLLLCLCEDAGIAPPPITVGENGKPDFAEGPYHFNITHAGNLVAVAIADKPVGVDIEPYVEWKEGRYTRFFIAFSVGERERIAKSPDPNRAIVEGWVRKEAALKQSGIGIAGFRALDGSKITPITEARVKDNNFLEYYLCITA